MGERYYKYTLIKNEDIKKYLSPKEKTLLDRLLNIINMARAKDGKSSHEYLVIGTHEPYAEEVANIMRKHGIEPFTK